MRVTSFGLKSFVFHYNKNIFPINETFEDSFEDLKQHIGCEI